MRECYFDPAMQAHKVRMQRVKKMQSLRLFFENHKFFIATIAAAFLGSAAFLFWKFFQSWQA